METLTAQVLWGAALSNGETIYEGKGEWRVILGELSPWNRLQTKLAVEELELRSLWLYTKYGQEFHLPGAGNPKFQIFQEKDKPYDFNMFRAIARDTEIISVTPDKVTTGKDVLAEHYTVVEAYYPGDTIKAQVQKSVIETVPLKSFVLPGYRLQIWVSEKNPKIARSVVAPMPK